MTKVDTEWAPSGPMTRILHECKLTVQHDSTAKPGAQWYWCATPIHLDVVSSGWSETPEAAQRHAEEAALLFEPLVRRGYLRGYVRQAPGVEEIDMVDPQTSVCVLCNRSAVVCFHPHAQVRDALALVLRVPRA